MKAPTKGEFRNPLITNKSRLNLLKLRGVPEGVLYSSFPKHIEHAVSRMETNADQKITRTISAQKQLNYLAKTLKDPFASNYVFSISGESNDALPLQIALQIFNTAIDLSQVGKRPFWHMVTGGTKDSLRDSSELMQLQMGGTPSLLVISNLASNSTMMKVEKVHDLINMFSSIPRILIIAGENPISYCSRTLHISVNRVLYFATKNRSE
jgi:hypothetical protein